MLYFENLNLDIIASTNNPQEKLSAFHRLNIPSEVELLNDVLAVAIDEQQRLTREIERAIDESSYVNNTLIIDRLLRKLAVAIDEVEHINSILF
jgi:hypothetical protein